MRRKTQNKTGIFQYSQGTLEQRYENYLTFSDDGWCDGKKWTPPDWAVSFFIEKYDLKNITT